MQKCDRGWDVYGRLQYSWIWVQNFKQSSYHAMLLLSNSLLEALEFLSAALFLFLWVSFCSSTYFDESFAWSTADWSCSTFLGLFCC